VGGGAAAHFTTGMEEVVPLAWGGVAEIKAFGQRLFNSVFDGEVRSFLRQSQEEARQKGSPGLRIRLQLNDVPELGQLPWEYLYDPTLDNYLCLSKATPVVRDDQIRFIRPDRPTLIRLYGHWRQADTLVVTEQDQNALLRGRIKRDLVDEVRHAFRRNSILFLGHDLGDPAVSAFFDDLVDTRSQIPSFAVWSGLSERELAFFEGQRNLKVLDVDPVALVGALAGRSG
jgi:hypothetical protein